MTTAVAAESQTILMDVMAYICKKYPYARALSKGRLTKLIYLADWKSAKDRGRQITDIEWHYNHYGPYVDDVVDVVIKHDDIFELEADTNIYGSMNDLVKLKKADYGYKKLQQLDEDKKILSEIIDKSVKLNWTDFIQLVYSSYPLKVSKRYQDLDLPVLARKYKKSRRWWLNFELIADDI